MKKKTHIFSLLDLLDRYLEKPQVRVRVQGFSQKGVQPSYGRPFLEETQGKFT